MCDQQRLRTTCAYTQSDQNLCLSLDYSMTVKLLTNQYLEFLCLKGGCTGLSETTLAKMPHCWKSHVVDQFNDQTYSTKLHLIMQYSTKIANNLALYIVIFWQSTCGLTLLYISDTFIYIRLPWPTDQLSYNLITQWVCVFWKSQN